MKARKRPVGKQFGPEPHQFDPHDGMSDKEFEAEVIASIDAAKLRQKAISIKLPEALRRSGTRLADGQAPLCIPYQTLIKIRARSKSAKIDSALRLDRTVTSRQPRPGLHLAMRFHAAHALDSGCSVMVSSDPDYDRLAALRRLGPG